MPLPSRLERGSFARPHLALLACRLQRADARHASGRPAAASATWVAGDAMATAPPRVLLGLCDAAVPPGEGLPWQGAASKLGGSPDWRLPAPVAHPACASCGAGLLHVVQVDCSLEGSPYHRVINVFACATKSCWGNSESYTTDGFGEKYEKNEAEKKNQIFYKFMKRISSCQEQILRYSWNGQPLFIAHPSADLQTRIPPCNNCKSKRIFEFQLMPALVNMLKTRENDTSIEFGTAVVYTCEKSCWVAGCSSPSEEFIFVQEDPDQQLFK